MAAIRGSGPMAERLRAFVRDRVHKDGAHYQRRAALDLAEALGKSPSWVSEYVAHPPTANADIDTAAAICEFFGVTLEHFTDAGPGLSSKGSPLAPATTGGHAHVQSSAKDPRVREIATLKTRIVRLEIALGELHNGARDLARIAAAARKQGRAPARRRA